MPGKIRWLSTLLAIALATTGLAGSAGADSGSEQSFLSAINSTRSSHGLGGLSMNGGLRSHARNHTADMIAAGSIFHSSSGELQAAAGSGWTKLGENVGRGGSVSSLHSAFLNSAAHRANILGDYNQVGIGTDTDSNGVLYVTVVFMKKGGGGGSSSPTTTAPKPTATTAKPSASTAKPAPTTTAPTTTTTTLPPTTTTTLIVGPDKPVTPGVSCFEATRFGWTCHD